MRSTGRKSITDPFDSNDYINEIDSRFQSMLEEVSTHVELDRQDRINIRLSLLDSINKELQKVNQ